MATVCEIPPVGTIYANIVDAFNQRRVLEAMTLCSMMTTDQVFYADKHYPYIRENYIHWSQEIARLK